MPGGADGQFGFITEVTPGAALTVNKFLPILSEAIKQEIEYMDTQSISARKTLRLTKRGTSTVSGTVSIELPNTTLATLLKHMFGTITTTGAGPFTHTATPGDLTGDSLTVQVGRPASTGVVHPFTYAGMKIATWSITATVGEIATAELGFLGMTETTVPALAVATQDASWSPFTFRDASLTVAGSASSTVRDVTISGDNKIDGRVRLGSNGVSLQPLEIGVREYTGTVTTDFDNLTDYNRFVNGTEAVLVLRFDNGAQTLTITTNVQFSGETPELSGFDLLAQTLPFRSIHATSDASAITAVLVNSEASAA